MDAKTAAAVLVHYEAWIRGDTPDPPLKSEMSAALEAALAAMGVTQQPEARVGGEAAGEPSVASMTEAFIERYESRYTPHTVELVMAEVRARARELDAALDKLSKENRDER